MATDWAADVKKYAPNADDGVIAGIVRYCGIALRKVDSSLVAFSDKKETDRVRENFLKKKLGLTQTDKTLDAAIAKVGERMKADRTKNRVTVYYLLAESFKKLDLFAPKGKVAAKAPAKAPAKKPAAKAAGAAALAGAAGLAAASAAKAPAKKKAAPASKTAVPAKTKAAPAKKAAAVSTAKKATTKKVAIKAAAAPQGLMDKAAGAGTAAVAGTIAAAGAVAATAATAAASVADAAKDTAAKTVDVAGAAVAGAAGLAANAAGTAGSAVSGAVSQLSGAADDEDSGLGWLMWLLLAALAAFVLWWVFSRSSGDEAAAPAAATTEAAAPAAPADLAAAPAEGTVAIPAGAGVTSELRDGKPVVKVYFDTAKTDVVPAFADAAGGLKAWLDANSGSSLAISGYNDPSGNAAANAELAKNRAQAVQAALIAAGIPEASALLVKPEETADSTVPPEAARRVEVVVK